MPSPFFSLRRALPPALLLLSFARAQSCYYPDGETISNDIPCNGTASASSCCSADDFCLDNGLCFGGEIVTRGSCTDKTWGSEACAGYCKTVNKDSSIAISPCTGSLGTSNFVCGLESGDCKNNQKTFVMDGGSGFILRPAQIAALVEPALASQPSASACPNNGTGAATDGLFTTGTLAGVACGIAIPLILALILSITLWLKEKKKRRSSVFLYRLPEECKDDMYIPPPLSSAGLSVPMSPSSHGDSFATSRGFSMRSDASPKQHTFRERYESMKSASSAIDADLAQQNRQRGPAELLSPVQTIELPSPMHEERHELA